MIKTLPLKTRNRLIEGRINDGPEPTILDLWVSASLLDVHAFICRPVLQAASCLLSPLLASWNVHIPLRETVAITITDLDHRLSSPALQA